MVIMFFQDKKLGWAKENVLAFSIFFFVCKSTSLHFWCFPSYAIGRVYIFSVFWDASPMCLSLSLSLTIYLPLFRSPSLSCKLICLQFHNFFISYAFINMKPHPPPPGTYRGKGRDLTSLMLNFPTHRSTFAIKSPHL